MGTVVMSAADKQNEFVPGTLINKYQLVSLLSRDTTGTIYRASNESLQSQVALKVVAADLIQSPESLQRFLQETRRCITLEHPNLVRVLEVDHDGDRVYVATELHDGNSLAEIVFADGAIPSELVYAIVRQTALTLRYLHDAGFVHRAVSPQNILLTLDGDVKVVDLSYTVLSGEHEQAVTDAIAYNAPEQVPNSFSADQRSDQYSLGCVAYFLLSGRSPRGELTWNDISTSESNFSESTRVTWDQIPPAWQPILRRAMAWNIDERFPSINDFVRQLDIALGDGVIDEQPIREVVATDVGCEQCALESSNQMHSANLRTDPAAKPKRSFRSWLASGVRQLFSNR